MKTRLLYVLAMFACLGLIFTLCSCSKNTTTDSEGTNTVSSAGPAKKVGVTLLTKSHPFYQEMQAAMEKAAEKENIKLSIQSAEFDMKDQQAQIETFITQKMDAIIVCPVDSDTIGGAIKLANKANIPVFTADISANSGDVVCHIASDNIEGGRLAGEYMAKLLNGKGKVAIIDHPKVMSVRDRTKGFKDAIAKFPGIKIAVVQPGDGERTTSMNVMENILQSNPDINGVFGINDSSALGALAAINQAKKDKDIVIVGYDGDKEARDMILRGSPLKADAVQYPQKIGETTIEMIAKHLKGEEVPAKVPVEVGIIDKEILEKEAN